MSLSSTDVSDGDGAIGKLTADVDAVVIAVNTPVAVAVDTTVEESQSPSNPSDAHSTRAQLNQMAEILSNEVDSKLMNPTSRGDAVATVTRGAPTVASIDGPSSSDEKAPNLKNMSDAEIYQYFNEQAAKKQQARIARRMEKEKPKDHKFWNTQPVLHDDAVHEENEAIDNTSTIDSVRKEPYNMPAGFEWCNIDVTDSVQVSELYTLLNENYVEDDDCTFRFDYSKPFLQWALTPPGFHPSWHVGVRNTKTGALWGSITAIPVHMRVYGKVISMAEINFLCVHKKLRTKRLAPVLIKEVTRRVNLTDVWQAVYTAGVVLPKPVARCRYFHRSLDPKKLIECRFSSLPPKTSLQSHLKKLKLPARPSIPGLRPMIDSDVPEVQKLLSDYLQSKTHLFQEFTEQEVAHCLLTRKGVVHSYVVQAQEGGPVTDLCSFYFLNSSVINNQLHSKLGAVYSFYNIAKSVPLSSLMQDLLVLARNEGADVFNALNVMENEAFFEALLFGPGDGMLQYYLYNWKCHPMKHHEIGLVLL